MNDVDRRGLVWDHGLSYLDDGLSAQEKLHLTGTSKMCLPESGQA